MQLFAGVFGTYLVVYKRFLPFTKKKKVERKKKKEEGNVQGKEKEKRKKKFQSCEDVMHFCEESYRLDYLQDPFMYGSSTSLHPNKARYIHYYYMFIETHICPHRYLWTLGSCHA